MKTSTTGALIFCGVIVIAFLIGSYILTATFFGVVLLIGMVAIIESIPPLKWLVSKTSRIVDLIIFGGSIIAMAMMGLNMTAALTVAGLGFTLVYAPRLREEQAEKKRVIKSAANKFDMR